MTALALGNNPCRCFKSLFFKSNKVTPLPPQTVPAQSKPSQPDIGPAEGLSLRQNLAIKTLSPSIDVLCSMTKNGKIGSVYFPDGTRLRMTHGAGPKREVNSHLHITRYSVNEKKALAAYCQEGMGYCDNLDQFIISELERGRGIPEWASLIRTPADVPDTISGSETCRLIELFQKNQKVAYRYHRSRGAAVRVSLDEYTLSVLEAAILQVEAEPAKSIYEKNRLFYAYVAARVPDFAKRIRHYNEV